MLRKIAFSMLLFLPLSCLSAEEPPKIDGWTLLVSSDNSLNYGKDGSAYAHQGVRYIVIKTIPISLISTREGHYFKIGISNTDCHNEKGSIMYYTLKDQYIQKVDYIKGGTSVASYIADVLCSLEISE